MSPRTAFTWFLRTIDVAFVVSVAYLCWTLVWCGGPFERMGWIFPAFFVGPPLLLVGAVYFGVCAARGRRVAVPVAAIAGVLALSMLIGTGVLQKVRWGAFAARGSRHRGSPAGTRRDRAPLDRQLPRHRAHEHAGTVLIKFQNSWDGLLYVPAGMEGRTGTAICESVPRCCRAGGTTTPTDPRVGVRQ